MRYFLLSLCLFSLTSCRSNTPVFSETKWQNDVKTVTPDLRYAPHFKDGKFFNPWMPMEQGGVGRLIQWKLSSQSSYSQEEKNATPGSISGLKNRIDGLENGDFISWIGHTTFLIRAGGEFWLMDPMFSGRALLPKRYTPPALSLSEIATLKGRLNIVISHNHYDHFDEASTSCPRMHFSMFPWDSRGPLKARAKKQ